MKRIETTIAMLMFFPLAALAGESPADQALEKFKSGTKLFNAGSYVEAADQFRGAYELKPSYKILYNLAQSETAAKRYGVALEAFEKYLADGGDDIELERRDSVREEIKRLREMIGIVEIDAEEGAIIYVDGIKRGAFPTTRRIPVAGSVVHEIRATVNEQEIRKDIRVSGGDTITVVMKTDSPADASVEETPTEDDDDAPAVEPTPLSEKASSDDTVKKKRLFIAGIALAGTGGAALVAGSICGGLVLGKEDQLSTQCPDGICSSAQRDLLDSRDRLVTSSTVLWITGGVVAASGITLILVSKLKREKQTVAFVPTVGGLLISGRF